MSIEPELVPPRAPQRWFVHIDYGSGIGIELPQTGEAAAIQAAIAHLDEARSGIVKIGYYGFRSRVIVHTGEQLLAVLRSNNHN